LWISGAVVCMRLTRGRSDHSSLSPCDHRICRSTVSRSPVLTRDGICVPPTVTYLPYRVSGSTLTAVGRSQLLARWLETHSQILSGIQRAAQTVLSVCLKRTCSCDISASSAFRVLNDNALYKFTHSLTDDLDQCVALCKFIRVVTAVPNSHCPTRLDKLSTNSSVNMALHFNVN